MIRGLFSLLVVAALIGVGVVISIIFFGDEDEDVTAGTVSERLREIRNDLGDDVENIRSALGEMRI